MLVRRLHVVAFDVRGMGASTAPGGARPYRLERLTTDLGAVIDAVSPGAPVHLVGHDWGACSAGRRLWARPSTGGSPRSRRSRGPGSTRSATGRGDGCGPARRGSASFSARSPALGTPWRSWSRACPSSSCARGSRTMRRSGCAGWRGSSRARDIPPRRSSMTPCGGSASTGRTSAGPGPAGPDRSTVPVLLVIPLRDRYMTSALYDGADGWADEVRRLELDTGHWAAAHAPEEIGARSWPSCDDAGGALGAGQRRRIARAIEGSLSAFGM